MIQIVRPKTLEQLMIEIGNKEQNPDVEIILSIDLAADIATRIIRLEKQETNNG